MSYIQDIRLEGSYPSAEAQLVYSSAPADWVIEKLIFVEKNKSYKLTDVLIYVLLCKTQKKKICMQILTETF